MSRTELSGTAPLSAGDLVCASGAHAADWKAAAVCTQTTKVETETNGLMTYDHAVLRFAAARLREMADLLYRAGTVR